MLLQLSVDNSSYNEVTKLEYDVVLGTATPKEREKKGFLEYLLKPKNKLSGSFNDA